MAERHVIKNFGKTVGDTLVVAKVSTTALSTSSVSSVTASIGTATFTGGVGVFGHAVPGSKVAVVVIPSPGSATLGDAVAKINELVGVLQGYGLI